MCTTTTNSTVEENSNTAAATALSTSLSDQELRVACYCEENVWRLTYRKVHHKAAATSSSNGKVKGKENEKKYYAVFVSNPFQCVCYFHQLASRDPSRAVFWDYHVILLEQDSETGDTVFVYDIDSRLPYPCPLMEYLDLSFPDLEDARNADADADLVEELKRMAPLFRVIPAEAFLQYFASDRSHMWNAETQQWNAPPPTYDCIQGTTNQTDTNKQKKGQEHNLMKYINMQEHTKDEQYGTVLTMTQLRERFLKTGRHY